RASSIRRTFCSSSSTTRSFSTTSVDPSFIQACAFMGLFWLGSFGNHEERRLEPSEVGMATQRNLRNAADACCEDPQLLGSGQKFQLTLAWRSQRASAHPSSQPVSSR